MQGNAMHYKRLGKSCDVIVYEQQLSGIRHTIWYNATRSSLLRMISIPMGHVPHPPLAMWPERLGAMHPFSSEATSLDIVN